MSRKSIDALIAVGCTAIMIILTGIMFDYYYQFNDDVLMKDILSGVYTGTPEAHNIQMLWPVSAIISLLYRIAPGAPVYGLFLCACQYGCVSLIIYRAIRIFTTKRSRLITIAIIYLISFSIALPHFVVVQYTITVAIMAATASFIFYTIPVGLPVKDFYRQTLPAIILVILAYLIRSEMLLLMLPFIGITGLVRWNRENTLQKHVFMRYVFVIAGMFMCLGLCSIVDKLAYNSDEWKTFIEEFDNRTELYDYQYVPDYDENIEFYTSIDLNKSDVNLLKNYDYALDSKIDGDTLGKVAEYAKMLRNETLSEKIKLAIKQYIYRLVHFEDGVFSALTAFLYIMLIWAIYARKESTVKYKIFIAFLRVGGLFFMRSISWLYIVMGHRAPDRIIHSLYLIEDVILLAMIMTEFTSKLRERGYIQLITAIILIAGGIIMVPLTVKTLYSDIKSQDQINKQAQAIDKYCKSHPDNFYFEDVYSTIRDGETFNQKMFRDVDNSMSNYELIGGWASNSPLFTKKIAQFGITDISRDLVEKDNVFIICDRQYSMDWVSDYYDSIDVSVKIDEIETIASVYGVYRISLAD